MNIIGNPIMAGSGGKNVSSIIITGLSSTDTITCTKDGKSYTATWDETAQHWEIVGLPLGTFTVEATNGIKTTTETVLIDITGVYEIEMGYRLYLFKDGNECVDITGGWTSEGFTLPSKYTLEGPFSNENECLCATSPTGGYYSMKIICTNNLIDFSGYSTINCEADVLGDGLKTYSKGVSGNGYLYFNLFWYDNGYDITDSQIRPSKTEFGNTGLFWYEAKTHNTLNSVKIYRIWLE